MCDDREKPASEAPTLLNEKPRRASRNSSEGIPSLHPPSRVGVRWKKSSCSRSTNTTTTRNAIPVNVSAIQEHAGEHHDEFISSSFTQNSIPKAVLNVWDEDEREAKNKARAEQAEAVMAQQQQMPRIVTKGRNNSPMKRTNESTMTEDIGNIGQHENDNSRHANDNSTHENVAVNEGNSQIHDVQLYTSNADDFKKAAIAERMSAMTQYEPSEEGASSPFNRSSSDTPDSGNQQESDPDVMNQTNLATAETQVISNSAVLSLPQFIPGYVLSQPGAVAVRGTDFEEFLGREDTLRYDFGSSSESAPAEHRQPEHVVNAFLVEQEEDVEGGGIVGGNASVVPATSVQQEKSWRARICVPSLMILIIGIVLAIVGIVLVFS